MISVKHMIEYVDLYCGGNFGIATNFVTALKSLYENVKCLLGLMENLQIGFESILASNKVV